jgi:hypothetical protein
LDEEAVGAIREYNLMATEDSFRLERRPTLGKRVAPFGGSW